jgi:p-hydroxybenzoate 3-monooxygenase
VDRTQVGIIGAGPAGLVLALLLERIGIECVVLEARSREYVEHRVRAGLLEQNTVDLLRDLGVGERLDREGLVHEGIRLRREGETRRIPITELTGRTVTIYGQQEVVKDLIEALLGRGGNVRFEVADVVPRDVEGGAPAIEFTDDAGLHRTLRCDFVAGCDGFHGVSSTMIPASRRRVYELVYPYSWLGILAHAPPATDELIYAWHEHGFALYTMRSPTVSRLYLQVPNETRLEDWPDSRIWEELQIRLASDGWAVAEGEIFDRGLAALRSHVAEPLRHGRLLLAGDAAHIVPPTGAKGLNLAVNDVRLLAAALEAHYGGSDAGIDAYSGTALRRVWRAQEFSSQMTLLTHRLAGGDFEQALQRARLDYIWRSEAAARSLAENYAGLPAKSDF